MVKFYQVISFFNNLGKIVEKVVAEQLSHFCKINNKLHKDIMGTKTFYLTIEKAVLFIYKI